MLLLYSNLKKVFNLGRIPVSVWIIAGSDVLLQAEEKEIEKDKRITHHPIEGTAFPDEFVTEAVYRIANSTAWNIFKKKCPFSRPIRIPGEFLGLRQHFSISLKDFETPLASSDEKFVFIGKRKSLMIQKPSNTILDGRIYLSEENMRILFKDIWLNQMISVPIEQ